ncbi:hypothetical protein Q3G72_001476 [Acer saccharum]|nr:hypothetical protein Q3G72_001476 [Acer saccharum]
MKSEGLVPMEIPLGLIPRLMTKGESAWRKVKIEGSREKFPSGVFRRSEGIQCPTTDSSRNCVIGAEPGMAGPERLGHRNLDHLRAGKRKPPRPDQSKQQCRIRPLLALKEFTRGHLLSKNKGRSAAYCSRKHPTYTIVKSSAYLSYLLSLTRGGRPGRIAVNPEKELLLNLSGSSRRFSRKKVVRRRKKDITYSGLDEAFYAHGGITQSNVLATIAGLARPREDLDG